MGELLLMMVRVSLQVKWILRMKHDSPGYLITLDDQPSEKSPSTASATGRFGPGVAIAFVEEPLAVHTKPDRMMIGTLAERGFQRSVLIIVS